MAQCTNVDWFDLVKADNRWTLTDLGRLQCITTSLPNADQQYPSLLFFVGKHFKNMRLQEIHASNHITRRKAHGVANLLVDPDTQTSPHPLLFADCTPEAPCGSPQDLGYRCHEIHRHTVCGAPLSQAAMVSRIHVNLLFPFTHVVCIFADDLGGNRGCALYIEHWLNHRCHAGDESIQAHPHLLVTTTCLENLDLLIQVECHASFQTVFESYQVLTVDKEADPCNETFQRTVKRLVSDARRLRRRQHVLLNGVDLAQVFARATEVFSEDASRPADLLASSQHPARSLSPAEVACHLQELRSTSVDVFPEPVLAELMASALLVQGYPPGFHREDPIVVGRVNSLG